MNAVNFENEFKGKRVVVTGASGIIGGWIAKGFAEAGAELCLTDRTQEGLAEAARRIGGNPLTITADLTDAKDIERFAADVASAWGAPDIVVNNAGIYPSGFLLDIGVEDWDRIMGVNLRAPFLISQLFAKQMIAKGVKGAVVNISSGAAGKMRRTVVPYCISKTGLDRLTKGLALELAEYGIRVNAVEPGFIEGSNVSVLPSEHVASMHGAIPLGRPSEAEDIASAVLYLASGAAAYVTGATLAVDGGNSIGSLAVFQAKKSAL